MRCKRWIDEWSGVVLVLIVSIATLWLFFEGTLNWYIHPRYEWFALIMAGFGAVMSIAALAKRTGAHHAYTSRRSWIAQGGLLIIMLVITLVIPPAALTTITATQRVVNSAASSVSGARESAILKERGDYTNFTIKDWVSLFAQSNDPALYEHKSVKVSGFVTPSSDRDVYFVSRFLVTCCAVDARPIGVPVYDPGWQDKLSADQWVEVSGVLAANPHQSSGERTVVIPNYTHKIKQEADPYVY